MAYDITQLKADLEPKLHDLDLDKIAGSFYDKAHQAARNVINKIDPKETLRVVPITNAIYNSVYSYICPTDLKDNKIVTIRPQFANDVNNNFRQYNIKEFGLYPDDNSFTVEYDDSIKTIRLSKALKQSAVVNTCDSLTSNGTWAATAGASNLSVDSFNYVTSPACLKFDFTGTSGYVENSTMQSMDLTAFDETGSLFAWVYIPSVTSLTGLTLRWGNNSSNYFSLQATTPFDATAFRTGWNLVRFDWVAATETGTVDVTAVDYVRLTIDYSGSVTLTEFRLDSIMCSIGSIYEIVYYSEYMFRTTGGTWIEKPTSDNDLINLGQTSYNVLLYELAYLIAQELQAESSAFDLAFFEKEKTLAWANYAGNNKSQAQRPQNRWYRL